MKKIRKVLLISSIVAFFISAVAGVVAASFVRFLLSPVSSSEEMQTVQIPQGTSAKVVGEILEENGLIRSSHAFYAAVRIPEKLLGVSSPIVLRSGRYKISPSMSVSEIVDIISNGKEAFVTTVIPEGFTIRKIARILENGGVCSAESFIKATKNREMLESFGINAENCEGYLFPDTYSFYENMDANEVVSIMIKNFHKKLSSLGIEEINYKTLVLASIVEREYRVTEEAPLIASVFKNRVDAGVGLYSCATIEYVITEILGKPHPDIITYNDLKIDSPYNTYRWAALPPGPISNPGLVALSAALNPPETNYFFFTLTDAEAGRHTFSTNITQHINATAQFRTKRSN